MTIKKRLILCLDGTWNIQDSSTNVLHHFNFIREGPVMVNGATIEQRKQYFRGVGTGPLDRITGGGFGFGLEQNVRDAYNWLVTHYNDVDIGPDSTGAGDEIFIFGFSRGAYTARSLVGLIATYGILRHGAPLSASQLWQSYCVLGRQREKHNGVWERIFGNNMQVPRRITDLKLDPWLARVHETISAEKSD